MKIINYLLILSGFLVHSIQTHCMQREAPLLAAASHGELKTIHRLITRLGISVNSQNELGQTALMTAVACGQVATVKSLITNYKADLEVEDSIGRRALHYAACLKSKLAKDTTVIADILIKAGANFNAQTAIGFTPLHLAIVANRETIATLLIAFKVNTKIRDKAGLSALDYAEAKQNEDLIFFLRNFDTSPSTEQKETASGEKEPLSTKLWIHILSEARAKLSEPANQVAYINGSDDDGEEETEELVDL